MRPNFFVRIKIAAVIVIACIGFSCFYLPNDARITFSYTTHDRGTMFEDDDNLFKFPFQNTGTQPLIISMVKSSCGCLVPLYSYEPLLPGAWDTIYGRYDMNRLGPINKTLSVTCNDSLQPYIALRIKGNVIAKPLFLKLINTYDSTEIRIDEFHNSEIYLANRREVTIELQNETNYDREIKWRLCENLKIESEFIMDSQAPVYYVESILPACAKVVVKVTILKIGEYGNTLTFDLDDSHINIKLKSEKKK